MEVTEHYGNYSPEWQKDEIDALLELVKNQVKSTDDNNIQLFYGKIYGKLLGERMNAI